MIPAKNRDRKCSTCRHYQPSPLWRKGWCRNPLLYDRNTNHLVEADSLACNRTFIDYWEPITGPTQPVGPAARSNKPRIAPSIPIDTMDAKGRRGVVTGNTPASGMAAVAPQAHAEEDLRAASRDAPRLSLVTPDYDPALEGSGDPASKVTRQIETIEGPDGEQIPATAAQRIQAARAASRTSFLSSVRGRLIMLVLLLVILAAGGGFLVMRSKAQSPTVLAVPSATATRPLPTPTGFGDATATPVPTNTPVLPPPGQIGVNGWVQVQSSNGLILRDAPGTGGKRIGLMPNGTKAHVIDGPKDANGFTWWKVDHFDPKNPQASGWSASKYMVATGAP